MTTRVAFVLGIALLSGSSSAGHAYYKGQQKVHSSRSYLGIDIRDVSDDQAATLKLKEVRGAQITRVDHDGPAGKAGLSVNDVVLRANNQQIESEAQLRRILRETPAGRTITLQISRGGQLMEISAELADRAEVDRRAMQNHYIVPEPAPDPYASDDEVPVPAPSGHSFIGSHLNFITPYTGIDLDTMGPQLAQYFGIHDGKGMLVREVEPRSPAAVAGIRAGDVILRLNGSAISSKGDWAHGVHESKGRPASVTILREHQQLTLTMLTDGKKRSSVSLPPDTQAPSPPAQVSCLTAFPLPL